MALATLLTVPYSLVASPPALFAWQRALAGMTAYCTATVICSPVDVVKTRMQLRKHEVRRHRIDDGHDLVPAQPHGVLPMALHMLKNEGALVFFSGLGPALLMAPAAMVQFTLMDPLRAVMPLLIAAAIAGALDITIKCPFERLKTKLQCGGNAGAVQPSALTLLLETFRDSGIRGLWAGFGPTLARDLPYLVLKWLVYAQMQALLELVMGGAALTTTRNLLAGATAGAVAATAVTPADVIKTRLQAVRSEKTTSPMRVAREAVAEGGLGALFSGIGPRLMRIPVYTAVTLATFDFVKDLFSASNMRAAMTGEL